MRNKLAAAALYAAAWWAAAAAAELDLSDFDTFLMQDMDAAIKDLEPLIGAKDVAAATETVAFLRDGLTWTEGYFAAKDGADDAVAFARDGRDRAAAVLELLGGNDFAAAAEAARGVAKSCRSCHDVYRP